MLPLIAQTAILSHPHFPSLTGQESEDKLPIVLKLPPLIRLSQPNNIRTYLSLRLLLKVCVHQVCVHQHQPLLGALPDTLASSPMQQRFGSSMMTRSQVLTAMILIEYAVFTAALVIQEVAGLSIINESFVVLVVSGLAAATPLASPCSPPGHRACVTDLQPPHVWLLCWPHDHERWRGQLDWRTEYHHAAVTAGSWLHHRCSLGVPQ